METRWCLFAVDVYCDLLLHATYPDSKQRKGISKKRFQKNGKFWKRIFSAYQIFDFFMETETPIDSHVETSPTSEEKPSTQEVTPQSFDIHIKCINSDGTINGVKDIRIHVKRTDLIAMVKQKYIDTGLCEHPDYIVLQYNGNELLDNTTVMENDLREDSTVFHQYSNVNSFSKVNYGELAQLIHDEALKNK